jgi:hypothetical protein
MTKKQKLEYKLGNARRRIAGGENTPPDTSEGAKKHLALRESKLRLKLSENMITIPDSGE